MNELEKYIKNELEMYCFLKNPKPKVPYLPNNVYIEPTNACNLHCTMCARAKMYRKIGFMKLADFRKIIDKLVNSNWYVPITLIGNGESLLSKDIFSMIEYAKQNHFNVSLISNSTLLTKEKIRALIESGLDRYQTMFDSIDRESFEALRPDEDYDKTKQNIIDLIEANEQAGHPIFISIGLVDTSLTKKIEETTKFWKSFPIDNFYHSPLLSLQNNSGMYEEAMNNVKGQKRGICVAPFIALSISYNGDAILCAIDFNNIWVTGNIFKDSMNDIWNGEKAQRQRKALIDDDKEFFAIATPCDKCNTPYLDEYNISGYMKDMPTRIARKTGTFHSGKRGEY
jgi:MoaA/NifB/PqqE/SkfB family radical SAM enzyme